MTYGAATNWNMTGGLLESFKRLGYFSEGEP